ncbi:MAG TPA: GH25 family lysozyme [Verrucomicrobiae bacterium]|nr:GH25 family lysozyme [Verrucomicrobiae bacterium]
MAQRPLGIDVSSFQGSAQTPATNINWPQVKSAGISFAWAKATEGLTVNDADFSYNIVNARGAGVLIGAYHFAHPELHIGTAGADEEAAHFWSVVKSYITGGGTYVMPMLDIEQEVTNASPHYTQATLSAWVNEWCQQIVNDGKAIGVAVTPVVYTFVSYATGTASYGPGFDASVTKWPLWMAQYPTTPNFTTGAPSSLSPWSGWAFWQYGSTSHVSGITGDCDVDVLNGTTNTLLTAFVIGNVAPSNVVVNPGSNATFRVTAGGTSLTYQWQSNQVNIPGATGTSYTVTNTQLAYAGPYSVVVKKSDAPFFTATASLGVSAPLTNATGAILAPTTMADWFTADSNPNDIFGTNHFTPFNNVTYVSGEQGKAFHFDGNATFLSNSVLSLPVPWTFSVWVNRQNAPSTGAAITGDGTNEIKLEQYNGTRQVGYTQFGNNDFPYNYIVPLNTWTHLAFVGTSGGVSLYANGTLEGTITGSFPLPLGYIGAGWVASSGKFVDYMLGSLDEMLVFKRALSAAEIHSIYLAGSAGLVRAPEIVSAPAFNEGEFKIALAGQTGKTFTVHASTNLATWQFLGTIPNPTGTNVFTDISATNAQTFYRISQP